jgi:hypothetical protein
MEMSLNPAAFNVRGKIDGSAFALRRGMAVVTGVPGRLHIGAETGISPSIITVILL